jgi:hypothetical protein
MASTQRGLSQEEPLETGVDVRLTSRHIWLSTLLCGGLGLALLVPLLVVFRDGAFGPAAQSVTAASALFWGLVAVVAVLGFWTLYYRYFYPPWIRYLLPLDLLLYGAIGLGLWALAWRLPGPAVLGFVVLGGLEGLAEHLVGIYGLHILDRVPWLRGLSPRPILVFSFFEYVLYWTVVAWLAWGLGQLLA